MAPPGDPKRETCPPAQPTLPVRDRSICETGRVSRDAAISTKGWVGDCDLFMSRAAKFLLQAEAQACQPVHPLSPSAERVRYKFGNFVDRHLSQGASTSRLPGCY